MKQGCVHWIAACLAAAIVVNAEEPQYFYPPDSSEAIKKGIFAGSWGTELRFDTAVGPDTQLVELVSWNWTDSGDDTQWIWRINGISVSLPANATRNGEDKVAMSAYALAWYPGAEVESLREKVEETTTATPPKFCMAYLNPGSDFAPDLLKEADELHLYSDETPSCERLLSQQCVSAVENAFTDGLNDDCSGAEGAWKGDVPACEGKWQFQPDDFTFNGNILANGTPTRDDFFTYVLSPYSSDDLSTWYREANRTQVLVVKEGDKPAKLVCTTLRQYPYASGTLRQFEVGTKMLGWTVAFAAAFLLI